jgi:hypothetical protein
LIDVHRVPGCNEIGGSAPMQAANSPSALST